MRDAAQHGSPRVLVVQRRLTHYRLPFFEATRAQLASNGIDFTLAIGDPTPAEREKQDEGHLDWAVHVPCTYRFGDRMCWQNLGRLPPRHDLVVLPQENMMLSNLPLLLGSHRCRVGLWGHGRNFQAADGWTAGIAQRVKTALSRSADWWFAYTDVSADIVRSFGYPDSRITVLNNSIDTTGLAADLQRARVHSTEALRAAYDLATSGPLGLYLGSLYAHKRLDLLIDGATVIKRARPDFQLAVVGAGPEAEWLQQRTSNLPWVHLFGARHGNDKAELLACADVMLNPGLVGLGILDAFVAGLPMVTTDCDRHSPEIAYLDNGGNGLMTQPDAEHFAAAVLQLLDSAALSNRLRLGCAKAAVTFGLGAMVDRFCQGVLDWHASERLHVAHRNHRL